MNRLTTRRGSPLSWDRGVTPLAALLGMPLIVAYS
jgi:hypothetical protein